MKRIHFSILTVIAFATLTFTACKKEDIKDNGPTLANWTKFLLMGDVEHGKCVPGYGLCLTFQAVDPNSAADFPLGTDELLAEPVLGTDGTINFSASIPASQLSPEAKTQLIERRFIEFKNDVQLDKSVVQQAYSDARVPFEGQQVTIQNGVYDAESVETTDATGNLVTIELCWRGDGWSICITIEF